MTSPRSERQAELGSKLKSAVFRTEAVLPNPGPSCLWMIGPSLGEILSPESPHPDLGCAFPPSFWLSLRARTKHQPLSKPALGCSGLLCPQCFCSGMDLPLGSVCHTAWHILGVGDALKHCTAHPLLWLIFCHHPHL